MRAAARTKATRAVPAKPAKKRRRTVASVPPPPPPVVRTSRRAVTIAPLPPPVLRLVERIERPIDPRESDRCKILLADIIRRSAYDWVLYRGSTKIDDRKLADDAYYWLFTEPERPMNACFYMTGFLSICDILGVNPAMLRAQIKRMQRKDVLSVSRRSSGGRSQSGSTRSGPPVLSSVTSLPEAVNQQLDYSDAVGALLGY